jgi:hypothetical protein
MNKADQVIGLGGRAGCKLLFGQLTRLRQITSLECCNGLG